MKFYSLVLKLQTRFFKLKYLSRTFFVLFVVSFFNFSSISAQSFENPFNINLDYAVFLDQTKNSYVEIYYGFNKSGLTKIENQEGKKYSEAVIGMTIENSDSIFVNDLWRMPVTIEDSVNIDRIVAITRYVLNPGNYKLLFVIKDVNKMATIDSLAMDIKISSPNIDGITISDIELATQIQRLSQDKKENFVKNKLEVIPNPSATFGVGRSIIYYYVELYNMLNGLDREDYVTFCWVVNSNEEKTIECPLIKRRKKKQFDASVEVGNVNISSLASGIYYLNFGIGSSENEPFITRKKKFYIYNPANMAQSGNKSYDRSEEFQKSEFSRMGDTLIEYEYGLLNYLITSEGKQIYESLDNLEAKRKFIFRIWKSRDTNPETAVNEFRQDFLERVRYANDKFRSFSREGRKTDRGRVYMIFGPPDDVEYFPSTSEYRPYDIWTYYEFEGGVVFIFVDTSGYNEYLLVHSNATGELKNYDWKQQRARL